MVGIEHYITDSMVMVEEIGSALPPFPVPVDRLRRPNSTQEQPTPMNDPSCVRKYKGQKVVVIGTWGEWSWVAGEQSWKPFVVATSELERHDVVKVIITKLDQGCADVKAYKAE